MRMPVHEMSLYKVAEHRRGICASETLCPLWLALKIVDMANRFNSVPQPLACGYCSVSLLLLLWLLP